MEERLDDDDQVPRRRRIDVKSLRKGDHPVNGVVEADSQSGMIISPRVKDSSVLKKTRVRVPVTSSEAVQVSSGKECPISPMRIRRDSFGDIKRRVNKSVGRKVVYGKGRDDDEDVDQEEDDEDGMFNTTLLDAMQDTFKP